MGPCCLVEEKNSTDLRMPGITFESYAIVYLGITNTMKHRSIPAITLGASNEHGGYYFMSLYTGRRINSNQWDE